MEGTPGTPGEVRPGAPPTDSAPITESGSVTDSPSAPDSAPVTATAPTSGQEPFDVERLKQVWPAVLDSLAASASGMVASYFDGTQPIAAKDTQLKVGFPADSAFNRRNADRNEIRQQLAAAVHAVTGDRFRIEYDSLDSDQPAADPESEVMDEEDFIARVKSEFNAEEVI